MAVAPDGTGVQLGVGAVQPPERLGVVLAAPERLVGKIRLIQRPAIAVEVVVVRVLEHHPVLLAALVKFAQLRKFVAHKIKHLARMDGHVQVERPRLRELALVLAVHFLHDGRLAVDVLIVAERQDVVLVPGVHHREGQLAQILAPLVARLFKVVEGVVHPAQVPLVVKAQAAVLDGGRDLREARRVLGDQNGRGVALLQTGVHALQEFQRRAVDAAVRVALPVDQAGHGIHAQAVGVEHPQPVVGAGLDKAADLTAGVHKVAAAPLALAHRGGGVLIQRRTVKFF